MFAGEKLLCKPFFTSEEFVRKLTDEEKLACISVRIPLEFNSRTLRSQEMEKNLVDKHMRVCLTVDPGFETVITVAPSEPLLAEASYLLMRSPAFDLPRSLLAELEHPGLDKGNRGELIAMTLCLQARDAASTRLQSRITPVRDFIQELLVPSAHDRVLRSKPVRARNSEEAEKTLEDTFRDSNIYFNHFVKIRDRRVISRQFLWGLIARGAAALCADFQYGIDIVIPYLFWDRILRRQNVSAFLIQVKNDETFKESPQEYLFDMMNPYRIEFFDKNESHPVPLIRMLFALASENSSIAVLGCPERTQPVREGAAKARFQADRYTSFDIWCAKASKETFRPIENDAVFDKLLLRSRLFPNVYEAKKSEGLQNATRSMNPATDIHPAHWDRFV